MSVEGTVLAVFGASTVVHEQEGGSLFLVNLGGIAMARRTGDVTTRGEQLASGLEVTGLDDFVNKVKGRSCAVRLFHDEQIDGLNFRGFLETPLRVITLSNGTGFGDRIFIWHRVSWLVFAEGGILVKPVPRRESIDETDEVAVRTAGSIGAMFGAGTGSMQLAGAGAG